MNKLNDQDFLSVIRMTPLVSVDLLILGAHGEKVLLGKRAFAPAKGSWFVPGGRIRKGETINQAIKRVSVQELGCALNHAVEFFDLADHNYEDNVFEVPGIPTQYVVLCFSAWLSDTTELTIDKQHTEMMWWNVEEALANPQVHPNTKAYLEKLAKGNYRGTY